MFKQIIGLVMILMILLGTCACSSSDEATKDTKNHKDKKTLSIALLYNERLTESAIIKFEAAYPDIRVEVKDYEGAFSGEKLSSSTVEDEQNRSQQAQENYKKSINTSLMAGNGPDIIDTINLPYRKLAEKNLLANMSELIKNDKNFDINNYQQKLLNACKYKDNLYIMPINFFINNTLGINKNIMNKECLKIDSTKWTWEEFFDIAQKIKKDINGDGKPDQYALPKMTAIEIFNYIYDNENFINYDKKTANFNSKEFIEFLNFVMNFPTETVCSPTMDRTKLIKMTNPGTIGFMWVELVCSSFGYNQALFNGEVEYLDMPLYNGKRNSKCFQPYKSFAINEKSELKEEAWEFIKVLLSDGVQSSTDNIYFPVNLFALQEQVSRFIGGDNSNFYEGRNVKALTLSDVDMINKVMGEIETIDYWEDKAEKIVSEGAKEFFSGKKTAEEAAKQIQNKINIYLGE